MKIFASRILLIGDLHCSIKTVLQCLLSNKSVTARGRRRRTRAKAAQTRGVLVVEKAPAVLQHRRREAAVHLSLEQLPLERLLRLRRLRRRGLRRSQVKRLNDLLYKLPQRQARAREPVQGQRRETILRHGSEDVLGLGTLNERRSPSRDLEVPRRRTELDRNLEARADLADEGTLAVVHLQGRRSLSRSRT